MGSSKPKLVYGQKGKVIHHISEVHSGLACGCVCPSCHAPLIARKGKKSAHHFVHASDGTCPAAIDVSLRLAAKRVIEEAACFMVPKLELHFGSYKQPWSLSGPRLVTPDAVGLAYPQSQIVPNLALQVRTRTLHIEFNTKKSGSRVSSGQSSYVRDASTVEIDLSSIGPEPSLDMLHDVVVMSTESKRWLHNVRQTTLMEEIRQQAQVFQITRRGGAVHIDGCPLPARVWQGKAYANVIDDCLYCNYCFDARLKEDILWCLGKKKISSLEDWTQTKAPRSIQVP